MSIDSHIKELKSIGYSPAQICSILEWNHNDYNLITSAWAVGIALKMDRESYLSMIDEYNSVEGEWN